MPSKIPELAIVDSLMNGLAAMSSDLEMYLESSRNLPRRSSSRPDMRRFE
jgi:hypothetical protein